MGRSRTVIRRLWMLGLGLLLGGCLGDSELRARVGAGANVQVPPSGDASGEPGRCEKGMEESPGRVELHRLNRSEYDNTVRDLLGDGSGPAQDFPTDDYGYGFDNIAAVLSISPLLVEKYDAAAERLVEEVWDREWTPGATFRIEAEGSGVSASTGTLAGAAWNLWSNGTVSASVNVARSGTYGLKVRAFGQQAGTESVRMAVQVDGQTLGTFLVTATASAPQVFVQSAALSPGNHQISVAFLNDFQDAVNQQDRNLFVDWLEVTAPGSVAHPETAQVLVCDPTQPADTQCPRRLLQRFVRKAWRRPPAEEELKRLLSFVQLAQEGGDDAAVGVKLALHAVLLSPHFLFRVELDAHPHSPTPHRLSAHELAARLSYFLWSSMPDAELDALADSGALDEDAVLEAQVRRMLADSKSVALVKNFAGQWLYTRSVAELSKDAALFPGFDDRLRASMEAETERFFQVFLEEDRSFLDMLDADFTFLNDTLARHYGLPSPGKGEGLVRVQLPPSSVRRGLLTQGSVLSVTSHSDRTSPVKRGKWVLSQLLCREPPPPPPEVMSTLEVQADTATLREQLEQHRANAVCASCHAMMDPIGLGLEHFDAVGHYRTQDNGQPIDATGTLTTGEHFDGARELAAVLKTDPQLSSCVTEKLLTYALGRGDLEEQVCMLEDMARKFGERGYRLRELVTQIVQSDAFRMRRGENAP